MNSISQCKPLLGTYVEISLSGEFSDSYLLDKSKEAFAEIGRIQKLMSFHDRDSELSYVNHNAHHRPCGISKDLSFILNFSMELSNLTGGLFDVTIASKMIKAGLLPDHGISLDVDNNWESISLDKRQVYFKKQVQLDLGGIAKGYAVDKAFEKLKGLPFAIVNAGGDLRVNQWENETIGIKVPGDSCARNIVPVRMLNSGLATSAFYYNKKSLVVHNSIAKKSIKTNRSVSVFAPSCMVADALTKVVLLSPKYAEILELMSSHLLIVDNKGHILDRFN